MLVRLVRGAVPAAGRDRLRVRAKRDRVGRPHHAAPVPRTDAQRARHRAADRGRAAACGAADAPLPAGVAGQRAHPRRRCRPGGGAAAGARPGGVPAQRGGARLAVGAARLRGAVRHQDLAAEPAAGPAAGRVRRLRHDRPHRPRPRHVGARRGLGLQAGQGCPLGQADRERAQAAAAALHPGRPRPARHRAGGRPLPGAGRRAEGAGDGGGGRVRRRHQERPAGAGRVLGTGAARGRLCQRDRRCGSARATCSATRSGAAARIGACARPAASAGCRGERHPHLEPGPGRRDRAARPRVRLGRRRHRQDLGADRTGGCGGWRRERRSTTCW